MAQWYFMNSSNLVLFVSALTGGEKKISYTKLLKSRKFEDNFTLIIILATADCL